MKNGGENNYHRTTIICSSPARSCSRSPADDTTTTGQSQTSSSGTLPTTRHIESVSRLSFGIREILGAERINPSELLIPIAGKDSNSDRSAKPWPSPIVYLSGRPLHPTRPTELGFGYAGITYLPGLSNVQRHFAHCAESVAQGHRVGLRPDYLCPEFRGLVERLYSSSQSDAEREHLIGQDLQRDMSMSQRHLGPAGMNLASAVMSSASSAFAWMSERKDRMQGRKRDENKLYGVDEREINILDLYKLIDINNKLLSSSAFNYGLIISTPKFCLIEPIQYCIGTSILLTISIHSPFSAVIDKNGSTQKMYKYSLYNSTRLIKPNPYPSQTLR